MFASAGYDSDTLRERLKKRAIELPQVKYIVPHERLPRYRLPRFLPTL